MGIHFVQLEERHRNMIRQLSSQLLSVAMRKSPGVARSRSPLVAS